MGLKATEGIRWPTSRLSEEEQIKTTLLYLSHKQRAGNRATALYLTGGALGVSRLSLPIKATRAQRENGHPTGMHSVCE